MFSQTSAILYTQDICFAFPTLCLAVAYFKIVPEMCLLSYLVLCQCPSCEIVHPLCGSSDPQEGDLPHKAKASSGDS